MAPPPPLPENLDRFEVVRKVGEGAAGDVYQARDRTLDRVVALKVLKPEVVLAHPDHAARFRREAAILIAAPHPAIVPLLDAQLETNPPYLVARWMPGGDLTGRIERGPAPVAEVVATGRRLAEGLEHLHGQGILHRDLKAENVLLDDRGEAYLADLGLGIDAGGERYTATGFVVGTPRYMAPEVLTEARYSPASDVFSLALVLLEVAAGRRLSGIAATSDAVEDLAAQVEDPALVRLLRRVAGRDEAARSSARAFASALAELGVEAPGTSPRVASVIRAASPVPPTPTPRSRGVPPALFLAGLVGLVGLGAVLTPGPEAGPEAGPGAMSVDPPPATTTPPSPFGPDLAEELQDELDEALTWRFADGDRPSPDGTQPFREALLARGVALLATLPAQARVMEWFAAGRDLAALPPQTRDTLRAYDASFADLALPPPFEAFLEAAPRAAPPEPPTTTKLAEAAALLQRASAGSGLRAGWLRACQHHLARALDARTEVEERIVDGRFEVPGSSGLGSALLATSARLNFDATVQQARKSPAGRRQLRDHLDVGLPHARAYLVAASLALRAPADAGGPSGTELARELADAFMPVDAFLAGMYVTARPRQLFFGPAGNPAEAYFRLLVLKLLRYHRSNAGVRAPLGRTPPPARAARALERALAAGDREFAARIYVELLDTYRDEANYPGLLDARETYEPRVDLAALGRRERRQRDQLVELANRELR